MSRVGGEAPGCVQAVLLGVFWHQKDGGCVCFDRFRMATWATAALCFFMSSFMSSWSSSIRDCRSFFSRCTRLSCSSSWKGHKAHRTIRKQHDQIGIHKSKRARVLLCTTEPLNKIGSLTKELSLQEMSIFHAGVPGLWQSVFCNILYSPTDWELVAYVGTAGPPTFNPFTYPSKLRNTEAARNYAFLQSAAKAGTARAAFPGSIRGLIPFNNNYFNNTVRQSLKSNGWMY